MEVAPANRRGDSRIAPTPAHRVLAGAKMTMTCSEVPLVLPAGKYVVSYPAPASLTRFGVQKENTWD